MSEIPAAAEEIERLRQIRLREMVWAPGDLDDLRAPEIVHHGQQPDIPHETLDTAAEQRKMKLEATNARDGD